ncbi:hypothetical protein Tco_0134144, partial [Tanacetum coccineum]
SCFPKPPDSIKNWSDHFFWVDSCVFPISVPLYTGGVSEKDLAPHLTARQEQTVMLLESYKAPFRRYPECFLCLVGLSPYYPFDENSYPAFEYPDRTEMGLFDFIKTADPRKVQTVEVQKKDNQVKLLESTKHCFMSLKAPAAGGSSSATVAEVPALTEERQENVAMEDAYLELMDPDEQAQEEEVVREQPEKVKRKRLVKRSDSLPVKRLRKDYPKPASSIGGKTLVGLEQIMPVGSRFSSTLSVLVDATAAATTSTRATEFSTDVNPDLAGPSQLAESEGSDDSFYESLNLDPFEAKRWSPAENELELKEKLRAKYIARGKLLGEKDLEILRLKSQLAEKEAKAAEVIRLRDQVSSLSEEKSALAAEVSALKVTISQKDHDISLLDSRATHLASTLDDAKAAYAEAGTKITSLASERDRLASKVSSLHAGFQDFKEKMEVQQEEQAQELYNRVAELEAQEGLEAGYEHGITGRNLSMVDAYNPEVAKASYVSAVKALEDARFPLVDLLKSKKDTGMDEVLDCFLLDGPLAGLPEAAYLQPCIEQLSVPIHHAGDETAVGETSLSFALMNIHSRAEGAKKHNAALRQRMMEIVSAPLSSQT